MTLRTNFTEFLSARHPVALAPMADVAGGPRGVGFLSWALDVETLQWILEHGPKAIMLSFGDPSPFANAVRDSSAKLIIQVTDLDEARRALEVGPDVIVVQGSETSRTASEHNESNWLPRGEADHARGCPDLFATTTCGNRRAPVKKAGRRASVVSP